MKLLYKFLAAAWFSFIMIMFLEAMFFMFDLDFGTGTIIIFGVVLTYILHTLYEYTEDVI